MEEIKINRTKLIRARVTEDEVALIKTKAKYYGYKNLSKYVDLFKNFSYNIRW